MPTLPALTAMQTRMRIPACRCSFRRIVMSCLPVGVILATADRWLSATLSFAANLGDSPTGSFVSGTPWLEHLQRSVARELRIGSPIRTQPGDRRVVALVGPTGVGKTTTVAKLAAGFRIEARRRVGLLTIDTFRIAAVQQLKAYAEIMDLPMEVVEKPDHMRPALERLGDVDLVLIDTAGRSPRSDARIDQLVELLRSAQPDETHLVLSATSSASTIQSALARVRAGAADRRHSDEAGRGPSNRGRSVGDRGIRSFRGSAAELHDQRPASAG